MCDYGFTSTTISSSRNTIIAAIGAVLSPIAVAVIIRDGNTEIYTSL